MTEERRLWWVMSEKFAAKVSFLSLLVLVLVVYWVRGVIFLDPDFGWHLRMGEEILARGVPRSDLFSYTMPSYPHVDHEWLADVGVAFFYSKIGLVGLAGVDAFLVLLVLVVSIPFDFSKRFKGHEGLGYLVLSLVTALAVGGLLYYARVKYLVVSWLFLAVGLRVFWRKSWKGWRWALPLLFLVWANLHGGFVAGLVALVFVVVSRSVRDRKFEGLDYLVVVVCLLITLVNPYGMGLWREVWSSLSDSSLRWTVQEWQPAIFAINYGLPIYLAFSLVLVGKYRRMFRLEEVGLYLAFLIAGLVSQRHVPLWIVVSLPLTYRAVGELFDEIGKRKVAVLRLGKALVVAVGFSFGGLLLLARGALGDARAVSEEVFYPKEAVLKLKEELPDGEIFSSYNWGGYLIWKLPQKKVFVDGRMPSWRWEPPNEKESASALEESIALVSGEVDFEEVFEKYGVEVVVWPAKRYRGYGGIWGEVEEKLSGVFLVDEREREVPLVERLGKNGWEEVYRDPVSVILIKPKSE